MKRFEEIRTGLQRMKREYTGKKAGLDGVVAGDVCSLCGVTFDVADARIWTGATGKCHFRCYKKWKQKSAEI